MALLQPEERTKVLTQLGFSEPLDDVSLSDQSNSQIVSTIVQLRLPFIKMMHEITELLDQLGASIRGNVRFVVLPDADHFLSIDFGPQARKAMATALNAKLLTDHSRAIADRAADLDRNVRALCDNIRAMPVERYDNTGQMLKARSAQFPSSPNAFRDAWLADHMFKRRLHEYNPQDKQALRPVAEKIGHLDQLLRRLLRDANDMNGMVPTLLTQIGRVQAVIATKLNAGPVSVGYPLPPRSANDGQFSQAIKRADMLEEAILTASDFVQSLDALYDFLNLEIWKQRWRVYELWVLSRALLNLTRMGAQIVDTTRIIDGSWRLKFTKDSRPILSLDMGGQAIDCFYQYYQSREDVGDMPDIAFRIPNGRFIAVVDPKHGESYSRRDLNEVCKRYASAFKPYLSCVVNYFDVRETEELSQSPRSLTIYGLCPDSKPNELFDDELAAAFERALRDRGLPFPGASSIVVLFDGSTSTEGRRAGLVKTFRGAITKLVRQPRRDSVVLVFGDSILREGSLADLRSERILSDLPKSGTNLQGALEEGLVRLRGLPEPRQLWLFTDGEGIGDILVFEDELRRASSSILFVESSQGRPASALQHLSERIGGQYVCI